MQLLEQILKQLADGRWHSGEALGEQFGVSRAAIWKQLQQLEAGGLSLQSERGKGYRLAGPIELLNEQAIQDGLSPLAAELLENIELHFCSESTNTLGVEIAERMLQSTPSQSATVVLAEQQTAGRGRRGKTWVSPLAQNIYCSVVWRFNGGASALSGLSLAVGIAVSRALEKLRYDGVRLKWPNDLLWNKRKLAGILLEMSGDAAGPCAVVIGIGINLTMSINEPVAIDQSWVDLHEIGGGKPVAKNSVVAAVLNELLPILQDFERTGFSPNVERWNAQDAFFGEEIALKLGDKVILGVHDGVQPDGSIRIRTATGLEFFNGGEIG